MHPIVFLSIPCVLAYFAAGFLAAARRRPVMWEKARKAWQFQDSIENSVKWQFISTILVWWIYLPISWANYHLSEFTVAGDPQEKRRRTAELQRRIAQLEAENDRLRRQDV